MRRRFVLVCLLATVLHSGCVDPGEQPASLESSDAIQQETKEESISHEDLHLFIFNRSTLNDPAYREEFRIDADDPCAITFSLEDGYTQRRYEYNYSDLNPSSVKLTASGVRVRTTHVEPLIRRIRGEDEATLLRSLEFYVNTDTDREPVLQAVRALIEMCGGKEDAP